MDKLRYTKFHDKCSEIEQRLGRQSYRPLYSELDTSVVVCDRLLDFGAGRGHYAELCKEYFTLDTDLSLDPDFVSLAEAKSADSDFDAIISNQVLEHIPLDELDDVVGTLAGLMKPGATFLATIPNVHRGNYFFNDIDHKTPLMYYHVAAFFEMNGLEVIEAYRYTKNVGDIINPDNKELILLLEKLYELDPAQFIAVVGRKPNVG